MSETHLPDDLARWPDDPYALLGVAQNVERRELRRAYARLIRVYKPEHFPEQFRRIRDAYEKLDGFLQYSAYFENQNEEEAGQEEDAGEEIKAEGGSGKADEEGDGNELADLDGAGNSADTQYVYLGSDAPSARPRPAADDELSKSWRKAIDGDTKAAYRELRELERRRPGDSDLCVRLYWMLALSPQLDAIRDRRDWLAASLKKSGLYGPAMELYAREIQGDPAEALHSRCEELLKCDCPPIQLANFASLRWDAAGVLGHWEIVPKDLNALRERIFHADLGAWTRLLLSAAESLLWQSSPQADSIGRNCRKEADEYSEEHQNLENEFYRCDVLLGLASGWKRLGQGTGLPVGLAQQIRELLREGWLRPFGAVRPKLMSFWRPLVRNPRHALAHLDLLYRISPPAVQNLHAQVEAVYHRQHDFSAPRDRVAVAESLRNFYGHFSGVSYQKFRNQVLFFCVKHQIGMADFMEQSWEVMSQMHLQSSDLPERMHKDLPLHCLILACLAFWS